MSELYGPTSSWGSVAGRDVDGWLIGKASAGELAKIRESVRKQPSWLLEE